MIINKRNDAAARRFIIGDGTLSTDGPRQEIDSCINEVPSTRLCFTTRTSDNMTLAKATTSRSAKVLAKDSKRSRSVSSRSSRSSRSRSRSSSRSSRSSSSSASSRSSSSASRSRSRSRSRSSRSSRSSSASSRSSGYKRRFRGDSDKRAVKKRSASPHVGLSRVTRLYVGRLTRNVNRDHVYEIFGAFGKVLNVEMPMDRVHQHLNRGFAYVEYESSEDAEKALKYMDGGQIDGQEISTSKVDLQRGRGQPPPPPPPRRGGGAPGGWRPHGSPRRRRSPPRRSPPRRRVSRSRSRSPIRDRRRRDSRSSSRSSASSR